MVKPCLKTAGRVVLWGGARRQRSERTRLNLERRVEERTLELEAANRQLRSQIEKREAAEAEVQQLQRLEAVGQITSGVAHDFNNLLTVVLANARLLSRRLRDPSDQEGIELIRTAAERGAKLTAQLLAFSRKQRLEPQDSISTQDRRDEGFARAPRSAGRYNCGRRWPATFASPWSIQPRSSRSS